MNRLRTPDQFKTRPARVVMGIAGLILAYMLATRAIDTGSLWQYSGTILLIVLSTRLIIRPRKSK